ncbi:hypothetical protein M422DRAFT_242537 [Sphaerobolus stellatus SS14]|nr:hypothetical protein M422DRAFT_242537 [Sphaerobolus stellatus SS14]
MAPPRATTRTCGNTQAEAATTSTKKDDAPLLAKATRSSKLRLQQLQQRRTMPHC